MDDPGPARRRPPTLRTTGTSLRIAGRRGRSWYLRRSAVLVALVALALGACAPVLAPAPTQRQRAVAPAPAWPHAFAVLTFNAFMLPAVVFSSGQRTRAQLLLEQLSGYDAIVFQELFDEGARDILLSGLATEYRYATRLVGRGSGLLREDGGVIIVSRWPIEAEAQITFGGTCASVDCLADKGVIYARIVKGSRRYHLFGSHAQSDAAGSFPAVRDAQFRLFNAFVEAQEVPPDEPVLLAGDLNVDCHDRDAHERMLRALHATEIRPCGDRYTWDGVANELASSRVREYLDYVLLSARHQQPYLAWSEVLPLRSENYHRHDLSDHYAVVGRFIFAPLSAGPAERALSR